MQDSAGRMVKGRIELKYGPVLFLAMHGNTPLEEIELYYITTKRSFIIYGLMHIGEQVLFLSFVFAALHYPQLGQ